MIKSRSLKWALRNSRETMSGGSYWEGVGGDYVYEALTHFPKSYPIVQFIQLISNINVSDIAWLSHVV